MPGDLRLRILAALAGLGALTPIATFAPAAAALIGVLGLFAACRRPIPWRRLLHLEGFLILLFATLPFTLPGTAVFELGPLVASAEGLWRTATLACKVTASVLLIALFFAATDPLLLASAFRALHVPEALVRLFVAATRYLGLIRAEFTRLLEAMRARAFRPRSRRHTWRNYGYLLGMLLVRALERGERVEEAMRLRGYAGRFPRTELPAAPVADWIAAISIAGGCGLLLVWDRWGTAW